MQEVDRWLRRPNGLAEVVSERDVRHAPQRTRLVYINFLKLLEVAFPSKTGVGILKQTSNRYRNKATPQFFRQVAQGFLEVLQGEYTEILGRDIPDRQYQWFRETLFTLSRLHPSRVEIDNIPALRQMVQGEIARQVIAEQGFTEERERLQAMVGENLLTVIQAWIRSQVLGHITRASAMGNATAVTTQLCQSAYGWPYLPGPRTPPLAQHYLTVSGHRYVNAPVNRMGRGQVKLHGLQPFICYFHGPQPSRDFQTAVKSVLFGAYYYATLLWALPFKHRPFYRLTGANLRAIQTAATFLSQKPIVLYLVPHGVIHNGNDMFTMYPFQFQVNFLQFFTRCRAHEDPAHVFFDIHWHDYRMLVRNWWNRIVETQFNKENYHVVDEDERMVLNVANIYATFPFVPAEYYMDPHQIYHQDQGGVNAFFDSFRVWQQDTVGRGLMDWDFYAPKRICHLSEFTTPDRQCLQAINVALLKNGMPYMHFRPGQQFFLTASKFALDHRISFRIAGMPHLSRDQGTQWVIVVSPRHISLQKSKTWKPPLTGIAFYVNGEDANKRQRRSVDYYSLIRKPKEQWRLGLQLPLDPSLETVDQVRLRYRCLVIDFECLATTHSRQIPYMVCCVGYPYSCGPILYRSWSNNQTEYYDNAGVVHTRPFGPIDEQTCINRFVRWLASIASEYNQKDPLYIWGYNLTNYEFVYLLQPLTYMFGRVQLNGSPSQCKSFSILDRSVVFCDVLKILQPQKLSKACAEFDVVIQKQDLAIALYSTWSDVQKNFAAIKEYCYHDCVSTLLLLHKLQCGLMAIARGIKMPFCTSMIARKATASGLGWLYLIQGFLHKSVILGDKEDTRWTLYSDEPLQVYEYQRKSYTGGVVQVFRYFSQQRLYVVDVNSMYPFMCLRPMPWKFLGVDTVVNILQILKEEHSDMFLFQVVCYQIPPSFQGAFVATKLGDDGKNTYMNSYHQKDLLYIRGVVIRRIYAVGGVAQFKRFWRYGPGQITALRQFAQTFYRQRLATKSPTLKTCYKLLMNSVIGRFSMSPKEAFSATTAPKQQSYYMIDDQLYVQNQPAELPNVGRLVRITSYITDCSKVYLDQLASTAGYDNVYYCDTDSLIVSQKGYINLGSPGTKASKLGEFKCQGPAGGASNYYDGGVFKNRKDYILHYTSSTGEKKWMHKAKGIPKKFITTDYSEMMYTSFVDTIPLLGRLPMGCKLNVGDKVQMQSWRRQTRGSAPGVTITTMLKASSVIVDRFFQDPWGPGLPWSDSYSLLT